MKHGTSVCELTFAFTSLGFGGSVVGQSPPSPLNVKLMRASSGNGELLAPAAERVAWRVSLLPWSELLLGKLTVFILLTGLRGSVGSEKDVSSVCRMEMSSRERKLSQQELPVPVQTRQMVGDPCFFGLAPHLGTIFYVLVGEPG